MSPPSFGAAFIKMTPPEFTQSSIKERLVVKKEFNSFACPSLPSKKTIEVLVEKTSAGVHVSKNVPIHSPEPNASSIAAVLVVVPQGSPVVVDLI